MAYHTSMLDCPTLETLTTEHLQRWLKDESIKCLLCLSADHPVSTCRRFLEGKWHSCGFMNSESGAKCNELHPRKLHTQLTYKVKPKIDKQTKSENQTHVNQWTMIDLFKSVRPT